MSTQVPSAAEFDKLYGTVDELTKRIKDLENALKYEPASQTEKPSMPWSLPWSFNGEGRDRYVLTYEGKPFVTCTYGPMPGNRMCELVRTLNASTRKPVNVSPQLS